MTAYIRSIPQADYRLNGQPFRHINQKRRYVVTLSRRRHKRVPIGETYNPLAAALMAARAELS